MLNFFIITLLALSLLWIWAKQHKSLIALQGEVKNLQLTNKFTVQASFEINYANGDVRTIPKSPDFPHFNSFSLKNSDSLILEIHPDDRKSFLLGIEASKKKGVPFDRIYRRKSQGGDWVWLHSIGEVTKKNKHSAPLTLSGIHSDITKFKKTERLLDRTQEIQKKALKTAGLGYYDLDLTSQVWTNDPLVDDILGIDATFTRNLTTLKTIIHSLDRDRVLSSLEDSIRNKGSFPLIEYRLIRPCDKTVCWVKAWGYCVFDDDGNATNQIGLVQDITEQKKSVERLQLSARVFSDTHDGISITDAKGAVIDVNPAFSEITGYSPKEIVGKNTNILSSGIQDQNFYAEMWDTLLKKDHWQGEVWNKKKDGTVYAELLTISALKNEKDQTINYVGIFTDITKAKEQQQKLQLMAHYDPLTQLPNRALLHERFLLAAAHSKRSKTMLAICFLDLDDFKPVNDIYGHQIGDKFLVEVSKRIKSTIRDGDTVSRQGGDEFALLLGDIDSYAACKAMLSRIIQAISKPYQINQHSIKVSASLGVTLHPYDVGEIDTLIRHADQAMYQAKLSGKNRYHLYDKELDQEATFKHQRIEEIQSALYNDEFCLYYQPKVNMQTGVIYGVEALIRWIHPDKGLIPPLEFLPIIECTSLELQIGEWVIQQALKQMTSWKALGIKLETSVNIASFHLQSDSFIPQLKQALINSPMIEPSLLQLEILESSALGDIQVVHDIIVYCKKELGVSFALDDFGTGYSSLNHLRNLPAEVIKVDQSFICDLLDAPDDYTIVDGVISLAESFDRTIIAEGVEDTEHGLMLLLMGCEQAQGYGISPPLPANKLLEWINSYTPNLAWMEYQLLPNTKKSKRLKQLNIIVKRWKKLFDRAIHSSTDEIQKWPIMDATQCPTSKWIKREKSEQYFDSQWLTEFDQTHEHMHILANSLKTLHQKKQQQKALAELNQLDDIFNKTYQLLSLA